MSYTLRLEDSQTSQDFELLEIPIKDTDIEGATDSTTLSGDIFTDYLYLKKEWRFHWAYMDAQDYQDLRGFYTRQFARNVYPRMTVLDTTVTTEREIQTEDIYTGELIAFERGIRINNLEIYGKTEQATTTGKNLIKPQNGTAQGITSSYNEQTGAVTFSGTANTTYTVPPAFAKTYEPGTYTLTIDSPQQVRVGVGFWTGASSSTRKTFNVQAGQTKATYELTESAQQADVFLTGLTSGTAYNLTVKVMLEKGTGSANFEPYTAGPSPNPTYPQEVKSVTGLVQLKAEGVNIFDPNKLTDVNAIHFYGGGVLQVYTASGNYNRAAQDVTDIVKAHPGETLRASMESVTRDLPGGSIVELVTTYNDGTATAYNTLISEAGEARTATIPTKPAAIQKSELRFFANNSSTSRTGQLTITNLMLQIGMSKPYQPPLHSVTELNFGKNLFDKANATVYRGYIANNSTNALVASPTALVIYIQCKPNTTYTVQKLVTGSANRFCVFTTDELPADGVVAYNQQGAKAGDNNNTSYTITTGSSARYLCAYIRASATTATEQALLGSIQIERGTKATSYAAYKTPIELRKIGDAQDKIYKHPLTGQWYIRRETTARTFNGVDTDVSATGGWFQSSQTTSTTFVAGLDVRTIGINYADRETALMDHFRYTEATPMKDGDYRTLNDDYGSSRHLIIGISKTIVADLAAAKAWIAANRPTIAYKLLEPIDEPLTDWELITQLESALIYPKDDLARASGTIKAESSNGLTTQITANITTYGYEYLPTPIVENVTGRLKLTDGGVVDNCSGREDIELIIRESNQ